MSKIVVKYGLIAGIILSAMICTMAYMVGDSTDFEKGESFGYIFMVAAFSTIFFGIREMRDKLSGGVISFNKAFRTGLLITIIGTACYVITWMVYFNFIDNTFVERYSAFFIENVKESGKPAADIEKEIAAFKENMASYKSPWVMAMFTFLEVFPIGLIISILCAVMMKRSETEKPGLSDKIE